MIRRVTAMAAVAVLLAVGQAQADHSQLNVVMCRDVRDGDPVAPGSVFTGTDPQVCVHLTLIEVSKSHTLRYEVSRPDGSTYSTRETKTESAPHNQYYPRYRTWFCLPIAEHEPGFTVGDWQVKVLIDGRLVRTMTFQIIGVGARGQDKMRERLQTMKTRVDANPSDPGARIDLAEAHIDLNELDEAILQLRRAVDLDSQSALPQALLGFVYYRQDRLDEAERSLLQATHLKRDYAWAHFQLGRVYKQKGETAKAIEHFRRVVQIEGQTSLRKGAEEELAKLGAAP